MDGWLTAAIVFLAAVFVFRRLYQKMKARKGGERSCSNCSSTSCEGCPLSGSRGLDPSEGHYDHLESGEDENGDSASRDS